MHSQIYLHLHALQIISAFCSSISFAPTTHFLFKLANQKLLALHITLHYSITPSRSCTLQSQLSKNQRLRKKSQCPNVRFARWLYLYMALDCNYFDKMHEVTKVCRVQHCFEGKMFKTLVVLTLRASCVLNQHL